MKALRPLLSSCCIQTRTPALTDSATAPDADPLNSNSKKASSMELATKATMITPSNPTASTTDNQAAEISTNAASTSQTPMVSLPTEPVMATPHASISTPPTSSMLTYSTRLSKPPPQSKDFPIPSIELPDTLPDGAATESLSVSPPYFSTTDTTRDSDRIPHEHQTNTFRFGEDREASPFTFRKMYNATPEPTEPVVRLTEKPGAAVDLMNELETQQLARTLASSNIKNTSISTSDSLGVSNWRPGSGTTRKRITHGRYSVKDERPPNEPYFSEQFQKALQKGKYIAGRIKDTLEACELAEDPESHVFEMIKTATELHNFDAPAVCTIGVMGDSGVGKLDTLRLHIID